LAKRLRIGIGEASKLVRRFDNDRRAWFAKLANTEPEDRSLYDLVLDVDHNRASGSEIANQIVRESIQIKYGDEAHPAVAF
jgi:cytidylate kinase